MHVFAGPLADDLRLARPGRHRRRAAGGARHGRRARAGWTALPDGLDTVVGDGGHRLTVAQAQQLALARLVLPTRRSPCSTRRPPRPAAPAPGSSTRPPSRRSPGAPRIVVAHRLTQAAAADRIVVLDAGRVVENGTHAELLAAGGAYAALWQAWSDQR